MLSPLRKTAASLGLASSLLFAIPLGIGLSAPATAQTSSLTADVSASLQEGVEAWNAGDLPRFMNGYLDSPDVTFTSSGRVIRGHAALQQRYMDTYGNDRQSMGKLRFEQIEVWPLGPQNALALGHWHLELAALRGHSKDSMDGVFSLVLQKTPQGWKIIHDHTSRNADPKASQPNK